MLPQIKSNRTLNRLMIVVLTILLGFVFQSYPQQVQAEPDAVVTYDDASPSIGWTGAWTVASSAFAMAQTLHWTDVSYRQATLSFNGSRISYFYSMAFNRGKALIYIDDVLTAQVDAYAQETRRQIGKTWEVSPGNHTIRVVAGGGGLYGNFTDVDAFAVDIATVGQGVYDNDDPQIRYFGTWSDSTYTIGTYDNSAKTSNIPQSGFRFTFTGNEITYIYTTSANRGIAAVTIDGTHHYYIDQYSADVRRQIGRTFSGLGFGVHILNVVLTGATQDKYIDLDALVVGDVYDRTAAVSYADTWAHDRNDSNYPNYGDQGDTPRNPRTNYVSQVLEAGGMPQIGNPSYTNNNYYWFTYYIFGWLGSNTWQVTSAPDIASFKGHVEAFPARYALLGTTSSAVESLSRGDFFRNG